MERHIKEQIATEHGTELADALEREEELEAEIKTLKDALKCYREELERQATYIASLKKPRTIPEMEEAIRTIQNEIGTAIGESMKEFGMDVPEEFRSISPSSSDHPAPPAIPGCEPGTEP